MNDRTPGLRLFAPPATPMAAGYSAAAAPGTAVTWTAWNDDGFFWPIFLIGFWE